jgi:hypothetical protein
MRRSAGTILKAAGPSYIANLPEHVRDGAIETLNRVHAAADTFNTDLADAAANKTLSIEGVAKRRSEIGAAGIAALAEVETSTIKPLHARAVAIENAMIAKVLPVPPRDAAERVSYEMRVREVRDQLRGLSQAERANVYRSTLDPIMIAAFHNAPPTVGQRKDGGARLEDFISEDDRREADMERAQRADPSSAQTLREVRSLAEIYTHAVNTTRREMLDEIDPVSALVG